MLLNDAGSIANIKCIHEADIDLLVRLFVHHDIAGQQQADVRVATASLVADVRCT
jgi:hypothetical protein